MLEEFIEENKGKLVIFDGVPEHAGDHMQLIAAWCKYIGMPFRWPFSIDWQSGRDDDDFNDYWEFVEALKDKEPLRGDLIIFSTQLPGSDGKGHISIYVGGDADDWTGFDADWDGEAAHLQNHNWTFVQGWWTPIDPIGSRLTAAEKYQPKRPAFSSMTSPVRIGNSHDTILIDGKIPMYHSMGGAFNREKQDGFVPIHKYYVYRRFNGMMHLTRELGQPSGIWINPEDLEPKPMVLGGTKEEIQNIQAIEPPVITVDPEKLELTDMEVAVKMEQSRIISSTYPPRSTPDEWDLSRIESPNLPVKTMYAKIYVWMLNSKQLIKSIKEKYKEL